MVIYKSPEKSIDQNCYTQAMSHECHLNSNQELFDG